MKPQKWVILDRQDVSPSPWFPLVKDRVKLPTGQVVEYVKSQLAPVAMVVAITKQKEVVLVRQYKHGVEEITLEFPAGRIESGDTPEQTAIRELQEETGIVIEENQLEPLIELWTEPSKSSVRVHGFLVREVEVSQNQQLEHTENIEVVLVPVAEVDELLKSGKIHASDTVALWLWVREKLLDL